MKLLTILIGIVMLGTSSYIGYRAGYAKGLKAEGTASLPDILPAFPHSDSTLLSVSNPRGVHFSF